MIQFCKFQFIELIKGTSIHLWVCGAMCSAAPHHSLPCVKGGGTAQP